MRSFVSLPTLERVQSVVTNNLNSQNIDLFLKRLGSNFTILERKVDMNFTGGNNNALDKSAK